LLITIAGTLGRIGYVPMNAPPLNCNQAVAFVRLKPQVIDLVYACYACQAQIVDLVTLRKIGTIGNLNLEQLRQFKIPLPPLCEQKRIATILGRAERLRHSRRYALELTDTILPAAFLELFGDPVTNQMGWKLSAFEEVAPSRLGKMLDANQQTGKHGRPYLRNENVQWDRFDLAEVSVMDFDADDRKEFLLSPGDLLICEGGEPGRCAIWRSELAECYFQKALHRARPVLSKVIPEYVVHLLWSLARKGGLADHVTSATIAHLTGEKLKLMPIPVPPITLQQKFAARVERVERLRAVQREAFRQAEHLFASLLHRAFSG
jgi:type I restriction enzyme S subunit